LPACSEHRLAIIKHHSLQTLCDEWHGVGECLDLPVPGGIAALEASHEAKWHDHFSNNEIKNFLRVKMVVTGTDETQRQTQCRVDSSIDKPDLVLQEEAKKSVANMVIIVQMTRRSRQANQADQSTIIASHMFKGTQSMGWHVFCHPSDLVTVLQIEHSRV
jgi:hypothetical protein